jgi:hypothetical protein
MKKQTQQKIWGLVGAIAVLFACASCNNGTTEPTPEPAVRDFPNIPLVCNGGYTTALNIRDDRTNCGSATLEDLGLTTKIQNMLVIVYNDASSQKQDDFKEVLAGGLTIAVQNSTLPSFMMVVHNKNTIYVNIDYLKNNTIAALIGEMYNRINEIHGVYYGYP